MMNACLLPLKSRLSAFVFLCFSFFVIVFFVRDIPSDMCLPHPGTHIPRDVFPLPRNTVLSEHDVFTLPGNTTL